MQDGAVVLIVEDGDEYLENLSRYVVGPRYLQAHSGAEALELMALESVDLIYLDMRFDRIHRKLLLGDHDEATRDNNGDAARGWKYLQNNQGLYILEALRQAGFADVPVILAYDFSGEERRGSHLKRIHPSMTWVPDAVTPDEIRAAMTEQLEN